MSLRRSSGIAPTTLDDVQKRISEVPHILSVTSATRAAARGFGIWLLSLLGGFHHSNTCSIALAVVKA
jgi:hypothetical protein